LFKNQGLIPFIDGIAEFSTRMSAEPPSGIPWMRKNPFWNFTFQNGRVIDGNFGVDSGQTATKTRGVQGMRFPE